MFTVRDLMNRFGVSEHTVLGWIRAGELAATNVGRKPFSGKPRWRISEAALAAFEQARTPVPPQPRAARRKRPMDVIEFYK